VRRILLLHLDDPRVAVPPIGAPQLPATAPKTP